MSIQVILHPNNQLRLGDILVEALAQEKWTEFKAAVAFIKQSGSKHIREPLSRFVDRGGHVIMTAGIDVAGTTVEGLQDLMSAVRERGELYIFHNVNNSTYHPKVYLFRGGSEARIIIGSSNLTEGGLFTNYEANFEVLLDLTDNDSLVLFNRINDTLINWSSHQEGLCFRLTPELLAQLILENKIPNEVAARAQRRAEAVARDVERVVSIFRSRAVPSAPRIVIEIPEIPPSSVEEDAAILNDAREAESLEVVVPAAVNPQGGNHQVFLMTLQKTDVGVGQTTSGTQRRSPEIFIPLVCRDFDPEFWGWPDAFTPDQNWAGPVDQMGRGKMDRTNVMVRLAGSTFPVSIWYNPDKRDVRIRSEHIRSAGSIGDILYLERADGTDGYSYYAEIIPQNSIRYPEMLAHCTRQVRNSQKLWSYL